MNEKPIELKSLEITQVPRYASENAGQYVAKVSYASGNSETALLLTPDVTRDIMQFLGPVIVKHSADAARQVAESMQASIDALTNMRQIEAPKASEPPVEL